MANQFAIYSFASSLMTYLNNAYPQELKTISPFVFKVLSSHDLTSIEGNAGVVGLYLYRVKINEHLRSKQIPNKELGTVVPLAVDLHFLLSIWSDNAVAEHTVCAWVMQELNSHPMMDASSLSNDGGWQPGEEVQIIPAELSNEDLMRIWDAFPSSYRLSLSYIARVIRIDAKTLDTQLPVVAARYKYSEIKHNANE